MGVTTELTTYANTTEGEYWFTATVENGMRGLVRMNVAYGSMDSDDGQFAVGSC